MAMSEHKAWLILNGKQAGNDEVRSAVGLLRDMGWDLDVRVTWETGDFPRLTREALDAGCTHLIAGGGDGTLREVAEVLVQNGATASLCLLPLGTANDFARAAGISLVPAEALALLEVPPTRVDLGEMNGHLFVNMATGGFGSQVTATTPEELKRFLGGGAYLLTGLTRFAEVTSMQGRFSGPGFEWSGGFLAFGIGNGRQAGGGQVLCPHALVDDGLLDVCIVPASADAVGTLGTLLAGGLRGVEAVSVGARLAWLEVETPEDLHINLDGEPMRGQRFRFATRPGGLWLHLPVDSPLLGTVGTAAEEQA